MKKLQGRGITGKKASGQAMITREPMNFTAALSKPQNFLIPWLGHQVNDRHHELYKKLLKNKIFIYPATIGSTGTGMFILELIYQGNNPAAIIVGNADTLMVSGSILSEVWFGRGIPIVEYPGEDIYDLIHDGDQVQVDGESGEIVVLERVP